MAYNNKCNNFLKKYGFPAIFIFTIVILISGFTMINLQTTQQKTQPKKVNLSVFYINDVHGQVGNMKRIMQGAHHFDEFVAQHPDVGGVKVSSGDICIGADSSLGAAATEFKNIVGIEVETLGNHEFDSELKDFIEHVDNSKATTIITNIETDDDSPLNNKFRCSYIKEINGEKYGFLGVLPPELEERLKSPAMKQGIEVEDDDDTIEMLQEEVNNLEKQGINKIILLSHGGYALEKKIAQKVSGIDIIHGGHSHTLVKGVVPNENYFYSPRKEPVLYTQAGGDGQYFGILNVTFENGIIKAAKNNVISTLSESIDAAGAAQMDSFLGKNEVIGKIQHIDKLPKSRYVEEHPIANFMLDAIRSEVGADVAFMNSGSIRGSLKKGDVTNQEISLIAPFKNKLCLAYLNEAELIQTVENGLNSFKTTNKKPGIVQVSGLKYVGTDSGELKELYFIDKSGLEQKIDVKNPNLEKKYLVAADDFMVSGREGFTGLNKINNLHKMFDYDKDYPVIEYIKKQSDKPIVIKKDGRIKIIEAKEKNNKNLSNFYQPSSLMAENFYKIIQQSNAINANKHTTSTFTQSA